MRIRAIDRILVALAGALLVALSVGAVLFAVGAWPLRLDTVALAASFTFWQRVLVVLIAAVPLFLGGFCLLLLFRRSKEKGFFLQHTEYGDLNISMHAMENMVRKCINMHDELKVSGTRIHRARDGVVVDMRISLSNGVNIPLTVNALQKQIKHYITSCSGVDVKEVRVMVETNNAVAKECAVPPDDAAVVADANAAAQAGIVVESLTGNTQLKTDEPELPEEKEAFHQRLFKHEEEPHIVPPPPEEDEVPSAEEDTPPQADDTEADDEALAIALGDEPTEARDDTVQQ